MYWKGWKKAVSKSIGWIETNAEEETEPSNKSRALLLPPTEQEQSVKVGYSVTSMALGVVAGVVVGVLVGGRVRRS